MFTITRNGLEAIQKDLGVISNNIANANTNGFKRSRSEFVDMYSKALSILPEDRGPFMPLSTFIENQNLAREYADEIKDKLWKKLK